MARRRHYTRNPVAERQRRMFVRGIALTLLVAVSVFMVFMAITAS